jgi:hypothetical protein
MLYILVEIQANINHLPPLPTLLIFSFVCLFTPYVLILSLWVQWKAKQLPMSLSHLHFTYIPRPMVV